MKKLDLSAVTTAIGLPVKSGSLAHIQSAYQEAVAGYNPSVMYILNGVVNSGSGSSYNISAGSVFFNGEMYLVDAATFTLTGGNQAIGVLNVTYQTGTDADGVEFTDGIVRNIHEIRRVQLTQGLGGAGMANFNDFQRIYSNIPPLTLTQGTGISITGAYPNQTITNTVGNKILQTGYILIGDLNTAPADPNCALLAGSTSGLSAYLYTFPVAMANTNFVPMAVMGNNGHNDWGGFNDNFMCVLQVGQYTASQMWFAIGTTASGAAQSVAVKYALISTV
jgi:hypothetical protein